MKIVKQSIPDILAIEPQIFGDGRGFFLELFRRDRYEEAGITTNFVQDNLSRSTANVLRGLHLQNPKPQGKLVTVVRGTILDVAVDVRVGSPTFGHHVRIELSEYNPRQLWIPRGFAHGFLVLSDIADFHYKVDEFYSPSNEIILKWDDPALDIDWGQSSPIISQRDRNGRSLNQLTDSLPVYKQSSI
jgi:dTDP-4-dehydrorhamnose 3,5-epimerase